MVCGRKKPAFCIQRYDLLRTAYRLTPQPDYCLQKGKGSRSIITNPCISKHQVTLYSFNGCLTILTHVCFQLRSKRMMEYSLSPRIIPQTSRSISCSTVLLNTMPDLILRDICSFLYVLICFHHQTVLKKLVNVMFTVCNVKKNIYFSKVCKSFNKAR